MNGMKQKSARK